MTTTPILGLTELVASQAVPESAVNQIARLLEQGALSFSVKDKDLTAPPGSPAEGDAYVIAASPTGAWSGKAKNVAFLMNGGWIFIAPKEGMRAWMADEAARYTYTSSAWVADSLSTVTLDTDGTLAANSDAKVASQKATKTYVDTSVAAAVTGLLEYKGATNCSANPNYPAASKGDWYKVSVGGKIGGASGTTVEAGDVFIANADNAGGSEASVGTSWDHIEHNIAISDDAYDATTWNGNLDAPSKNAVRDKIEAIVAGAASGSSTTQVLTGTDTSTYATPDSIAALWEQGADVASAGTVSLGEGGYFNITGTTTITDVDFATDKAGRHAWVKFAGALTLTHNASTLILPTGANIVTAAGDTACFISEGSDVIHCVIYTRASGRAMLRGPSIQSVASSATVTPTFDDDQVNITAQAAGLTLANPTGTAVDGWGIAVRIKDNGTARSITFGSQYRAIGVTLPSTTVISKTLYLGMVFNNADTKWDVVAVAQEA